MHTAARQNGMRAEFLEFRLNIFLRHISVMTREAVVFFLWESEKARANAGVVSRMAIFAGVVRHGEAIRVRPRIEPRTIPRFVRGAMRGILPMRHVMATDAQRRASIVFQHEFSPLIVVRIVTRGALHFVVVIDPDFSGQRVRVLQLAVGARERTVVRERNGVIIRQIGSEIAAT